MPSSTQWSFEIPNSLVGDSYISTSNGEGGNVKKVADFVLKIPIYAQPSFEILVSLVNDSYIPTGNSEAENVQKIIDFELMSSISAVNGIDTNRDEALADASKDVEERTQVHLSWALDTDHKSCDGRGINVYELPSNLRKTFSLSAGIQFHGWTSAAF